MDIVESSVTLANQYLMHFIIIVVHKHRLFNRLFDSIFSRILWTALQRCAEFISMWRGNRVTIALPKTLCSCGRGKNYIALWTMSVQLNIFNKKFLKYFWFFSVLSRSYIRITERLEEGRTSGRSHGKVESSDSFSRCILCPITLLLRL